MRTNRLVTLLVASLLCAAAARAADYPAPVEGDFVAHDFRFAIGRDAARAEAALPHASARRSATPRASCATPCSSCTARADRARASCRGRSAASCSAPGQLLDATRYFIILPDGIGHGKSSKPSDGLHARFPHYNYDDMVRAQHRLLTDGLG